MNGLVYAEEAETAVLGALIDGGHLAMQHCLTLRPEMFALDSHQRIFRTVEAMCADGSQIDSLTVVQALRSKGQLEAVGGSGYVASLNEGLPRNFNPAPQAALVTEKWRMREVIRICNSFTGMAADPSEQSGDVLAAMQREVMDVLSDDAKQDEPHVSAYTKEAIERFLERSELHHDQLTGMTYGLPAVDALTDGMHPGQVTAVGARSGVGKSSLMLQAARANARAGKAVHLFSLEMTRQQCLDRLWAMESGVPYRSVRKPSLASYGERDAVKQAAYRVAEWPLRIHDKAELSLNQIIALARLSIRQDSTELFCVDYAQNVEAEGRDERTKVSSVSRTLTKLAKDEGAHMMLLSQLRKVPPEMYSKPPHVGDLRETGQIENDAHCVLLLHRPWDEERARIADHGEVIIPKQREGDTGAVQVKFNRNSVAFE